MIYDPASQTVVGSMGWVDDGALWVFAVNSRTESRIIIDGARFLGLRRGSQGLFRLVHHHSPDFAVSIRLGRKPDTELASVRFQSGQPRFFGDRRLWQQVDTTAIVQTDSGPKLILIDAPADRAIDLDLTWYTSHYDLLYQGLADCLTLADLGLILVSVQRSSELVLVDPRRNERVGAIQLAGRCGNPGLGRRPNGEVIATDYDTLCRIDARAETTVASAQLQGLASDGGRRFIGGYDLGSATCAVARPFSGDALLVDLTTFGVLERIPVAGQPLAICMTQGSGFVTRDWKTGQVEIGEFSAA